MFTLNRFSGREALLYFQFRIVDVCALVPVLGWPSNQSLKKRNLYAVQPIAKCKRGQAPSATRLESVGGSEKLCRVCGRYCARLGSPERLYEATRCL